MTFVWPSAEFSTYDVAHGLHKALKADGHELIDYQLSRRIQMCSFGLHALFGENPAHVVGALLHASEGLLHTAVANNCRWVLVISGMGLHPDVLITLRRVGIKIATVFTEGPYETADDRELRIAGLTDVSFVNERSTYETFPSPYRFYLPHAYDPSVHHRRYRPKDPDLQSDVLLVGTGFEDRVELLSNIDWTGIDLKLGGYWLNAPQLQQYIKWSCLDNETVAKLYSGAKIVINPHRYHAEAYSANPRVFEVAACNAFQICDYRQEIADIFGDAIPMYPPGNHRQLKAMIDHYLEHPEKRKESAARAHELVRGHTFVENARRIIKGIEQYQPPVRYKKEVA